MRKLLIITVISLLFFDNIIAQELKFKAGQTFVYRINEFDGPVDQLVQLNSIVAPYNISWNKKNKYDDKGTFIIMQSAVDNALNIIFSFPISSNGEELIDVLPGFMVSKKIYKEIKANKKSKIRTDCNLKSEDLVLKSEQPMYVNVDGKRVTINTLNVSWGTFGDEMWILDNGEFPIIVKVAALSKFELTDIR